MFHPSIVQLEVDDSRNILYARSEKGTIQVFDMGTDGLQLNKIIALNQQSIGKEAAKVALNVDKNNFFPIITIFCSRVGNSFKIKMV